MKTISLGVYFYWVVDCRLEDDFYPHKIREQESFDKFIAELKELLEEKFPDYRIESIYKLEYPEDGQLDYVKFEIETYDNKDLLEKLILSYMDDIKFGDRKWVELDTLSEEEKNQYRDELAEHYVTSWLNQFYKITDIKSPTIFYYKLNDCFVTRSYGEYYKSSNYVYICDVDDSIFGSKDWEVESDDKIDEQEKQEMINHFLNWFDFTYALEAVLS